ncbi:hypothetical protein C8Q70DRAFT_606385 [Cubamyces menziesii]|nr:hypothetical protein C8Q70DRAFT_606385 [Cubamyces menziesii]
MSQRAVNDHPGQLSHDGPSLDRPVTSKPRGICKYYNTERGCYAGSKCKFLHGETERMTPFDKNKVCRFYAAGHCRRGDKCWFLHADPNEVASGSQAHSPSNDEVDQLCSICYDKPTVYGLLGCSHVFCISCIKNWRGKNGKSEDIIQAGTNKQCPMCRTASRFVTPSAHFYPQGNPRKTEVIANYKASMARVKCRYFEKSRPSRRFCPFGKDCFYKHENADGTPYEFEHGAAYYMEHTSGRRWNASDLFDGEFEEDMELMLDTISRLLGRSQDWRSLIQTAMTALNSDGAALPYPNDDDASVSEGEQIAAPAIQNSQGEELHSTLLEDEAVIAPEDMTEDDDLDPSLIENDGMNLRPGIPVSRPNLDPTIPEFVPSERSHFYSWLRAMDPSYELDSLRPLPPGPNTDEEPADGGGSETAEAWEDFWRGFGERHEDATTGLLANGPPNTELDLASLLLVSHSPASTPSSTDPSSSTLRTPSEPSPPGPHPPASNLILDAAPEIPYVQNSDPPFMTDGRGRVVASSTTSSRARDGRRGRAASSSAAVPLPHSKPDAIALHDNSADASCNSPSLRHARQRSLSLIEPTGPGEDTPRAEFVTDGRGRVVFASNS